MSDGFLSPETLTLIQQTAVKASEAGGKVALLKPPGEPAEVYYLIKSDGSYERHVAEPEPRNHKLLAADQVCTFVESLDEVKDAAPVVWYSPAEIVVICDDDTRRDRATLKLTKTPQMQTLCELSESRMTYSQREFIRLLRIDLHGCFTNDRLLQLVRDVRFNATSNSGGVIRQGRESLGSDIEAEAVTGLEEEFPEEVELIVRVFDDPFLNDAWPVRCAVVLDLEDRRFGLVPYPLDLKRATDQELGAVAAYLAETCPSETAIFRGCP